MTDEPRRAAAASGYPSDGEVLAAVLARVRRGDEAAFAELYDLTSARIHGLVLGLVRSPELAAEITQEVYVEVWRQAARWSEEKGTVRAWMHTIAHHRAVDRIRSVRKQSERDTRWVGAVRETGPDNTWEDVEQRLDAEGVRAALEELSPNQKEAVGLAYYGGYSHREVAEMLEVPLGTVKTRIRDGLLRLRTAMRVGT